MTVTHQRTESSPYRRADDQVTFDADTCDTVTLAHYPRIDTLAVAIDDAEVASLDLEEFKKFARKVLADELAEPPAPEWHDAKVIRGDHEGCARLFLSDGAGNFITDTATIWSPEVIARSVKDIEIVVGADDE